MKLEICIYWILKRFCRFFPGAYRLLVADLTRDEELLHGHGVHGGEVVGNILVAVPHVTGAEVLLEVDNKLGCHDGVLQVSLHPFKAFHTLVTSVFSGITDSHGLTDVNSSIHKVVVDNAVEHPHVPPGDVMVTSMAVFGQSWAVVSGQVLHDVLGSVLDHVPQLVHLIGALVAGEPGVRGSVGIGKTKEKESQGGLHNEVR